MEYGGYTHVYKSDRPQQHNKDRLAVVQWRPNTTRIKTSTDTWDTHEHRSYICLCIPLIYMLYVFYRIFILYLFVSACRTDWSRFLKLNAKESALLNVPNKLVRFAYIYIYYSLYRVFAFMPGQHETALKTSQSKAWARSIPTTATQSPKHSSDSTDPTNSAG